MLPGMPMTAKVMITARPGITRSLVHRAPSPRNSPRTMDRIRRKSRFLNRLNMTSGRRCSKSWIVGRLCSGIWSGPWPGNPFSEFILFLSRGFSTQGALWDSDCGIKKIIGYRKRNKLLLGY